MQMFIEIKYQDYSHHVDDDCHDGRNDNEDKGINHIRMIIMMIVAMITMMMMMMMGMISAIKKRVKQPRIQGSSLRPWS